MCLKKTYKTQDTNIEKHEDRETNKCQSLIVLQLLFFLFISNYLFTDHHRSSPSPIGDFFLLLLFYDIIKIEKILDPNIVNPTCVCVCVFQNHSFFFIFYSPFFFSRFMVIKHNR